MEKQHAITVMVRSAPSIATISWRQSAQEIAKLISERADQLKAQQVAD